VCVCVCDRATNSYRRSWMLLKPIERDRKQKRESLISNGWMWEVVLSGVHRAQSGAVQLINEHSEDFRYCLDKQLLFLALRFPNTGVTMTIFSLYPSLWPVWGETWRSMCVCVCNRSPMIPLLLPSPGSYHIFRASCRERKRASLS